MKLSENRIIGGVCGGISERFQINSALVRVVFLVLSIIFQFPFLIYAFMWLVLPSTSNKYNFKSGFNIMLLIVGSVVGSILGFFLGVGYAMEKGYKGGDSIMQLIFGVIGIPIGAIFGIFCGGIYISLYEKKREQN